MSLAPAVIRQPAPDEPDALPEISVDIGEGGQAGGDQPQFDDNGAVVRIEHEDGSVTISLDGRPLSSAANDDAPDKWFQNLAERIDQMELGRISNDLLRGIEEDIQSRKVWEETRAYGMRLLGLNIDQPSLTGTPDGAPVEGMSTVRHPLLLEATLRFQANARSEMLPTDGPVKIREDTSEQTQALDKLADALEMDLNHYLTAVATEYYPDTDRMLMLLGFGGMTFKKVYDCPIRQRPVSESVDADDLIVNDNATDLRNAKRVTHKIEATPSTVRRMQLLGVYRDIQLGTPNDRKVDAVDQEKADQQGVKASTSNPEDRDRLLYECYCDLDILGFEHHYKGKPSGLEVPYRVTIDATSREILSLVRDYDEDTKDLPERRDTFVKYEFVPGFGFCSIGLLHILGNATNALTAAWRLMLDNGMFANFPGFLISKTAARQDTNIVRVPPGGAKPVETGGMPIQDAVMPLPYETQQMAPLMNLTEAIEQTGQRVGGTAELQVGEGRADAPVGTTLAMIQQAMKILNSAHKRMHASQAQEFRLLKRCFKDNPQAIVGRKKLPSKTVWTVETFRQALEEWELEPQADPNTASHTERMLKGLGLKQLSMQNPAQYDPREVDAYIIENVLQIANPEQFFVPLAAAQQPPPELLEAQAKIQSDQAKGQAALITAGARHMEAQARVQQGLGAAGQEQGAEPVNPLEVMKAKTQQFQAETDRKELGLKAATMQVEDANRDQDRDADMHQAVLGIAKELLMQHHEQVGQAVSQAKQAEHEIAGKAFDASQQREGREFDADQQRQGREFDAQHQHQMQADKGLIDQAAAKAKPKPKKPTGEGSSS